MFCESEVYMLQLLDTVRWICGLRETEWSMLLLGKHIKVTVDDSVVLAIFSSESST